MTMPSTVALAPLQRHVILPRILAQATAGHRLQAAIATVSKCFALDQNNTHKVKQRMTL